MQFFGELKQRGKKTPKRFGKYKTVLHDMIFLYRKKIPLTENFVQETGLDDEGIRGAVIKSLFQNWGIVVKVYGDMQQQESSPRKEAQLISDFPDDGFSVVLTGGEEGVLSLIEHSKSGE